MAQQAERLAAVEVMARAAPSALSAVLHPGVRLGGLLKLALKLRAGRMLAATTSAPPATASQLQLSTLALSLQGGSTLSRGGVAACLERQERRPVRLLRRLGPGAAGGQQQAQESGAGRRPHGRGGLQRQLSSSRWKEASLDVSWTKKVKKGKGGFDVDE